MLDLELLRTRLVESIYYLHIQPPLFNLFVGIVLKLFPSAHDAMFHVLYLVIGFFLYCTVTALQIRLNVSRVLAFALSTVFLLSPPFLLFEHWLFYTIPCALLLTASAFFLHRALEEPNAWDIGALFTALFLLCGIRSLFHLLFFALVLAIVLALLWKHRKTVLVAGVIPLILLVAWYGKNAYHFDQFTASTIMGKNLWVLTVGNMPWEQRQRWVEEGKLSELSLIARFNTTTYYPDEYVNVEGFEGIPGLRQKQKSNGPHNFNHLAHVGISKEYLEDAVYGLTHDPKTYILSTGVAWLVYLKPQYGLSPHNEEILAPLTSLYDNAVYWQFPFDLRERSSLARTANNPGYALFFLVFPLLVVYGAVIGWRGRWRGRPLSHAARWTLAYMVFCIVYVAGIGNAFDMSDTNRYRFLTEPFYLALGAVLIMDIVHRLGSKRAERRDATLETPGAT